MKRTGSGGFDMTHCETSPEELRDITEKYDTFFKESSDEMARIYPGKSLSEILQDFYTEATYKGNL